MRPAALLLAIALVLVPAAGGAQISILGLKNSLVQFVLRQISVEGEFEVTAEGVEEPEDGVTELVGVAVSDSEGVWLRAEGVALSWNPRRILRGQLEINSLVARGLEVLRRPIPPEVTVREDSELAEASFDPFAWPRLPITTRVEEMRLDDAFLAAGVIAGQSLSFDATGRFRDEGEVQALRLDVTRTDAIEGRILLDYERRFDDESLGLSLEAREAAGGVVAEIAGLPEDAASEVSVEASGPLADWSLDFDARTERMIAATGRARIDARAPVSIVASAEVRPGEALDPGVKAALGEVARLDLDVVEGEDGVVRIRRGEIASPGFEARADGTFDRGAGVMDFDLAVAALSPLAEAVPDLDFSRIAFDGRLEGPLDDFEAAGRIDVEGLATAPADLADGAFDATVTRAGDAITVAAEGRAEGLRLDRLGPDLLGAPALTLDARWDLAAQAGALRRLALESPALTLEADGAVDVAGNSASLDYEVATPDLAPIAAAYDVDASGRFEATGGLEGPLDAPRLSGRAALEGVTLAGESWGGVALEHAIGLRLSPEAEPRPGAAGAPVPAADETAAGRIALTAEGSPYGPASVETRFRLSEETLRVEDLTAEALSARLTGALTADLGAGTAEGAVTLSAEDLAPAGERLGVDLAGSAEARLTLTAPDGRQDATVSAGIADLAAMGAEAGRLTLEADLTDLTGAPSAEAELTATELAYPEAEARLASLSGRITGEDLIAAPRVAFDLAASGLSAAEARVAEVSLTGAATDLLGAPALDFEARAETLSAGAAEVAVLRAEGAFRDLIAAPAGRLTATAERIAAGTLRAREATLEAEGADLLAAPSGEARLEARALRIGDAARLNTVRLEAGGRAQALTVSLNARGMLRGDEPLRLTGEAAGAIAGEDAEFTVSTLRLRAGEARIGLDAPVTLRRADGVIRLEGLDLSLPGGGLTGDAALHPEGLVADLRLALADLAPLAELADAPIDRGAVEASARLDARPGSAGGAFDLSATGLRIEDTPEAVGDLALDATARWNGRRLRAEGALSGDFGEPARVEATLPLRPAGLLPAPPPDAGIEAALIWSGEIGELWAAVPAPDHLLSGRLDLDLRVVGRLADPRPAGRVELTGGAYQNLETGTILTDLSVDSRLRRGGGLELSLSAQDGAGAPVRGEVALEGATLSGTLTTEEAVLVRRDDVVAAISADIAVEGPLAAPLVSGDVLIDRAEVRLVQTGAPNLPELGDVRIKGAPPPEEETDEDGGPRLDLAIRAPRNVFVRGRGLTSEWSVDLAVAGLAASPRITGEVRRLRGSLNFIGREFDLARGRIAFSGRDPVDPDIDV
ncbi:MAG: translocation/assembly module TamB domain-containing protein, partial [Paracoccaceae bacterium]